MLRIMVRMRSKELIHPATVYSVIKRIGCKGAEKVRTYVDGERRPKGDEYRFLKKKIKHCVYLHASSIRDCHQVHIY